MDRRWPQFGLRSLFVTMAALAFVSEIVRFSVHQRQSPFLIGILAFSYGGLVAMILFLFLAALVVLGLRSDLGQRIGITSAWLLAGAVWVGAIVSSTSEWLPACTMFVALALGLVGLLCWKIWHEDEQQLSPEQSLRRLLQTKRSCPHNQPRHDDDA